MSDLFQNHAATSGPVECLGQTFPSDEARREHYLKLLAEKLKDPAFKRTEGFPVGSDEQILSLSNPPYYTACPNPFISSFVSHLGKPYVSGEGFVHEPFAADVSEGKMDPIYNAHSYHTKVPHKAIMRYILHYTQPGDIVYDPFCGTGMTGVAAQLCGDKKVIESLGYMVDKDGVVYSKEQEDAGGKWMPFSRLGARHAILNDLSPVASFIAANYNSPVDVHSFKDEALSILREVESEFGWMYQTLHLPTEESVVNAIKLIRSERKALAELSEKVGRINYTVWSDVFTCPDCAGEVVFWEAAVNKSSGKVSDAFGCPHCGAELTKRKMDKLLVLTHDDALGENIRQVKQIPVLINYSVGKSRFEKKPDAFDLELIAQIDAMTIPYWFPKDRMIEGRETRRNDPIGLTHVHHFYSRRNLAYLAALKARCKSPQTKLWFNAQLINVSKLNRYRPEVSFPYNPLSGTFYIGSQISEADVYVAYENKLNRLVAAFSQIKHFNIVGTSSATNETPVLADYIFTDPPFGANIDYSELSFLWEAWLGIRTDNRHEAIASKAQKKGLDDYRRLMADSFKRAYEALKPGRWMTVEFSNTQASVWNAIQTALQEAGFVVANVSALDKQQGSFKAVTTTTAVKQDLVISAYKPNGGLEDRATRSGGTEESVWDFVRTHLGYLPVVKHANGVLEFVGERDPRILFDRMIAWFVRHNMPVPMSSQEFQSGLGAHFEIRDGMVFLSSQAMEYDKKRLQFANAPQMELFVADERSAIDWLSDYLKARPSTYQDIHGDFISQLGAGWKKHEEKPELLSLLEENFLKYTGHGEVPSQIHSYLSSNFKDLRGLAKSDSRLVERALDRWFVPDPTKALDLEKKREKALLKDFAQYRDFAGRRLKEFRLEVMRAGFKDAWARKDYGTIVSVAQKLPEDALQEDEKLLLWYDQALTRLGM
ncbi:DNA methyltransferase [Pseudomonas aeruginosa]|uniref:DNA methyltransferase n=1 Tax=Pseudomonas aeruginosa TaxID=287 RepID=UPI00053E313D|nr:DNA methyltransferase [Pseudomonas aeruginosa]